MVIIEVTFNTYVYMPVSTYKVEFLIKVLLKSSDVTFATLIFKPVVQCSKVELFCACNWVYIHGDHSTL